MALDHENSLDLVLFLNGVQVATAQLNDEISDT